MGLLYHSINKITHKLCGFVELLEGIRYIFENNLLRNTKLKIFVSNKKIFLNRPNHCKNHVQNPCHIIKIVSKHVFFYIGLIDF